MKNSAILVVDDEEIARRNLAHVLGREGYQVDCAPDGATALALLDEGSYQLVLTDLRMPGIDGLELLRQIRQRWPQTEVVMITAHANASSAVEAMSAGAFYYVEKPFRLTDVRKIVGEAIQKSLLRRENSALKAALDEAAPALRIVSGNPAMLALIGTADGVAATDCGILIIGESGSGREALARYIHEKSGRSGAFIVVNCAAPSEEALLAEIFGAPGRDGALAAADGGTLFLDEVTLLPPGAQQRLLRVFEEANFGAPQESGRRLPGARLISAARSDLAARVAAGDFRQDLAFRLAVVTLDLPPLRKRRGDIPLLAMHFLQRAAARSGKPVSEITPEAFDRLLAYGYPGNLRELESIIERGVALASSGALGADLLPAALGETAPAAEAGEGFPTLEELERAHIEKALQRSGGNRALAAQLLGIDRVSLWRKLRRHSDEG